MHFDEKHIVKLTPQDESFLILLFNTLDERYRDPDFNMEDYGQLMTMSNSQLYRKTIALTGSSPNILLGDFPLQRSKEMLKKSSSNIAQIPFDAGFASPSYFTKCFKKKYGLLPMEYMAGN